MNTVLLVDDDPELCRAVQLILSTVNINVVIAPDALIGFEKLSTTQFDLLLSDGNLPRFSGFHLVRKVRQTHPSLPIAMLTGKRERRDIETAIQLGVNDYIVKPFEPETLIRKVKAILMRSDITKWRQAHLALPIQISSFSVEGLRIIAPLKLKEGDRIQLNTSLFKTLDCKEPNYVVERIERFVSGEGYHVLAKFEELDAEAKLRLRDLLGHLDEIQVPNDQKTVTLLNFSAKSGDVA